MDEENLSQEFRLKNIDETRNYLTEDIDWNELIIEKHKKVCATLNYIEHFLVLGSAITGCVSIPLFASLVGIPIGITSSSIRLKICPITAAIKKYKSIIKKKKKKCDKIKLLAKSKLRRTEALISKALIDLNVAHDESLLINNVLREYNEMKEKIKNWKN